MTTDKRQHEFGSCCDDLKSALGLDGQSLFRVEENGALYLAVGFVNTPEGTGWFDQAVIFCPFCGAKLQDRANLAARGQPS
jgi:hypothetical protein